MAKKQVTIEKIPNDARMNMVIERKRAQFYLPKFIKDLVIAFAKHFKVSQSVAFVYCINYLQQQTPPQVLDSLARQDMIHDYVEMIRQHNSKAYSFDKLIERLYDSLARSYVLNGHEDFTDFKQQIDVWIRVYDAWDDADKKKFKSYIKSIKKMRAEPTLFYDVYKKYAMFKVMKNKMLKRRHDDTKVISQDDDAEEKL